MLFQWTHYADDLPGHDGDWSPGAEPGQAVRALVKLAGQSLLPMMLALTQAGLSREDSYSLVQRNAMNVWESDGQLSLLDLLKADTEVTQRLSNDELNALFNLDYHLKHVDTIFDRVFGAHE